MSTLLYKAMLSKVRALLTVEAAHNAEQRKAQQWQLLFNIDDTQYVVGKGGVNTCFLTIGEGERKLMYPDELLDMLTKLSRNRFSSYAICTPKAKVLEAGILSEEEALKHKAPTGCFIVGMSDGKKIRLYVRQPGLVKHTWVPFKTKSKK